MKRGVRNSGFTLIEIMVVVAVLAIIMSVVMFSVQEARKKARDTQRISDMQQIELALRLYKDTNGHYPSVSDNFSGDPGTNGSRDGAICISCGGNINDALEPYLSGRIEDPLHDGTTYQYYYDARHNCQVVHPSPNQWKAVIFAKTMERTGGGNWSDVCGGTGTEGDPNSNSYMIVLGNESP